MCVCVHTYIHSYVRKYIHTYILTYVCIYVCVSSMCVCKFMYVCVLGGYFTYCDVRRFAPQRKAPNNGDVHKQIQT